MGSSSAKAPIFSSVIIPSFNSSRTIRRCLRSVVSQKTAFDFEVICVDSSNDGTTEIISKEFPEVRLIHLKKQTFAGLARNIGIENSKTELIAFLDSDCVAKSNWLEKITNELRDHNKNIVGGSIDNGLPANTIATAEYLMEFGEFMPTKKASVVDMIPSCNFGIRKNLYKKVGGFSNLISAQDVKFSHQINKYGEKIYFNPQIEIIHYNREKIEKFFKRQIELGIGAYLFRKVEKTRGYLLAKSRIFVPAIPFIRIIMIWKKVFLNDKSYFFKLIVLTPFIFSGLIFYTYGFLKGFSYAKKSLL